MNQTPVKQNFNSVKSIVDFNKQKNNAQVDSFTRQKNASTPSVSSARGDILEYSANNKNALRPTVKVMNGTRESTSADLANVRKSFNKPNPVRYYADFTIISAIENATKSGKFHLDNNSVDILKKYLIETDPIKDVIHKETDIKAPDEVVNKKDDPVIVEYNPVDNPIPVVPPQKVDNDSDTPTIPTTSKWKSRLWTAAKWAGVLAALGITYKGMKANRRRNKAQTELREIYDVLEAEDDGIDMYSDEEDEVVAFVNDYANMKDDIVAPINRPKDKNNNGIIDIPDFSDEKDIDLEDLFREFELDEKHTDTSLSEFIQKNPNLKKVQEPKKEEPGPVIKLSFDEFVQINEKQKQKNNPSYVNMDSIREEIKAEIDRRQISKEEKKMLLSEWCSKAGKKYKKREDLLQFQTSDGKPILTRMWDKIKSITPKKKGKKTPTKSSKLKKD